MVALVRSVAGLTDAVRGGSRVKFLFFWGHQPQRDGSAGAGCLSQWWPAPFSADGLEFPTAEHYMMWRKAVLFGDEAVAAKILAVAHPHAAKTLGRQVEGFDEQVWEQHRFDIVVAGAVAKFGQHEELREFLLGTGERVLVEASPVDRVWGIGMAVQHPHAVDPLQWRGLNLLGFALMQARTTLRAQASSGSVTGTRCVPPRRD